LGNLWPRNFASIALAASHRVLRRWNQTGQKFAGADDIAHVFLSRRPSLLWVFVIGTYCVSYRDLKTRWLNDRCSRIWSLLCFATTLAAFVFKLSFTAADSPELLNPTVLRTLVRSTKTISLVMQARLAFTGIVVLLVLAGWRYYRLRTLSGEKGTKSY
jgi:ethanolamine phosphate transferase 2 subunit G